MTTAPLLRLCLCSLLIICLAIDTTAQRAGRRRSVTTTVDTTTTNVEKPKEYRLHCEKRTIPGELFSRADLIRSQKELTSLQYFNQQTIDTVFSFVGSEKNCWAKFKIDSTIVDDEYVKVSDDKITLPLDCRETTAINQSNVADAYPYLSADGLRMYFTSSRKVAFSRLHISTRKNINDPFGEPEILSPALTEGYYGATLTADELTICMVKSGDMYISIRNSVDEKFPEPVLLKGTSKDYHFGPSISPDGKEIIVTVDKGGDVTRMYKRTGKHHVKFQEDLPVPEDAVPGPGQFSKDGLSYYLALKTTAYGTNKSAANYHLWYYSRASLEDNFSSYPEELPEQMEGLKNILQPSLNGDGSILAFVTSPRNLWEDDDILLVSFPKKETKTAYELLLVHDSVKRITLPDPESIFFSTYLLKDYVCEETLITIEVPLEVLSKINDEAKKPAPAPATLAVKVYPNPFATSIVIETGQLPESGAQFDLYDISGKMIRQEQINNRRTTLSLDRFTPGIYMYRLISKKGELLSSGKLVKAE